MAKSCNACLGRWLGGVKIDGAVRVTGNNSVRGRLASARRCAKSALSLMGSRDAPTDKRPRAVLQHRQGGQEGRPTDWRRLRICWAGSNPIPEHITWYTPWFTPASKPGPIGSNWSLELKVETPHFLGKVLDCPFERRRGKTDWNNFEPGRFALPHRDRRRGGWCVFWYRCPRDRRRGPGNPG